MLNVKAFALAAGILWGAGVLVLGLINMSIDIGAPWVELIGSGYIGFEATLSGSIIGGIWGFIDAFIGGAIFAWLYNMFAGKKGKQSKPSKQPMPAKKKK